MPINLSVVREITNKGTTINTIIKFREIMRIWALQRKL